MAVRPAAYRTHKPAGAHRDRLVRHPVPAAADRPVEDLWPHGPPAVARDPRVGARRQPDRAVLRRADTVARRGPLARAGPFRYRDAPELRPIEDAMAGPTNAPEPKMDSQDLYREDV